MTSLHSLCSPIQLFCIIDTVGVHLHHQLKSNSFLIKRLYNTAPRGAFHFLRSEITRDLRMFGYRLLIVSILTVYVQSFAPIVGSRFFRAHSLAMVVTKDVNMPALSSTMTEGKIVAWNKKVGEKVSAGDVLLIVESDKADMDVEAYEDGYLAAIYTPEGESAAVGAAVAILVDNLADIANIGSAPVTVAPVAATAAVVASAVVAPVAAIVASPSAQFEQVTMPALSSTMTEGKVVSWSKKIGDKISSGDMVLIVESDKADMDVESYEDGFLAVILVGDGESAAVGSPVGLMAKTVADIPSVQAYAASLKSGGLPIAVAAAPSPIAATVAVSVLSVAPLIVAVPTIVNEGRVASSGYAKMIAKEQNIDLRTVTSSRSDGLITSRDLSSGTVGIPVVSAYVPAAGTINASPMARKLALENNLDVTKIKGTGNFGRVLPDDVLIAAGKKLPPVVNVNTEPIVAVSLATTTGTTTTTAAGAGTLVVGNVVKVPKDVVVVLDGIVPMDGMQKAVAKNMEKTMNVPVFRVSRSVSFISFPFILFNFSISIFYLIRLKIRLLRGDFFSIIFFSF